MNLFNRAAASLTLAMALTLSTGCMENIALIGRPTPRRGSRGDLSGGRPCGYVSLGKLFTAERESRPGGRL